MDNKRHIDGFSFGYEVLRWYIAFFLKKIYYRRVEVFYQENIPDKQAVIIAPNHQNALMDALNILTNLKKQPVFLARADLFKKPLLIKILTFLKLAPIFRIRDGKDSLKLNDAVFDSSVGILERNNIITMFPEGNHGDREVLRVLKKGIARIAFLSEQKHDFNLGIRVVPVGINYSDYYSFRSDVFINVGKAFDIIEFREDFDKNPPLAFTAFNEKLSARLRDLMIHIEEDEYYDSTQLIRNICIEKLQFERTIKKNDLKAKFEASKQILSGIHQLRINDSPGFQQLIAHAEKFREILGKLNIDHHTLLESMKSKVNIIFKFIAIITLSPAFFYGLLWNYLPYKIPVWISNKKIKDKQFHSSVKFVLSALVTFPLFYIMYCIIALFVLKTGAFFVFVFSLPFSGLFAYQYSLSFIKLLKVMRMQFFQSRLTEMPATAMETRDEIFTFAIKVLKPSRNIE